MKKNLEYRMYGLVPYNISPIQQGIQFGHAVVEYGLKHFKDPEYQKWATTDKTFIILNGGTTNTKISNPGSLNLHLDTLRKNKVKVATFHEPDLGDQLTAIVFLVDERVFDKKKYPGPDPLQVGFPLKFPIDQKVIKFLDKEYGKGIGFLREFLKQFKFA